MPSKPANFDRGASAVSVIQGWQVLEVAGRDAAAFLQRQTMNDVAALTESNPWHWNGLLSSKGRLLSLFIAQRRTQDSYWLIAADTPSSLLREQLARFVFRDKLTLTCRDDLLALGAWDSPGGTPNTSICDAVADRITNFEFPFEAHHRTLKLMSRDEFERAAGNMSDASNTDGEARWRLDDLRCGIPRLAADQIDRWTPHMLALDRLPAFSLKKGCYPGQEIIARTHYLGRSKRRLQRFDLDGSSFEGELIVSELSQDSLPVLLAASWNDQHSVAVVAPVDGLLDSPHTASGLPLTPTPFVTISPQRADTATQ